jgi:hypothetical protein
MIQRTTFALDQPTAQRLKRLARLWNVSQDQVVRRSVEQSERSARTAPHDPVALLQELRAKGGGVAKAEADRWIAEVNEDRKNWRAPS